MKKSTLLKLSPALLLLSLLAGTANVALADEKASETTSDSDKAADTAEKSEAVSDAKGDATDGEKKKAAKEPDCD